MRSAFCLILLGWGAWPAIVGAAAAEPGDAAAWRVEARARFAQDDYAGTIAAAEAGLALLSPTGGDPLVRAGLWQWAGVGAEVLGDYAAARSRLETALGIYRATEARREVAATLNSLAAVYARQSDRPAQLAALVEAHAIFEDLGEVRGRAALSNSLGNYYSAVGEPAKALPYHEQSVALRRTLDAPSYLASGLENLGITRRELEQDTAARADYEEALALYRQVADQAGLAGVLTNLGSLAGDEDRLEEALGHYREALGYDRTTGYKPGEAILLRNIGATLRRMGRPVEALTWLDQAVALAEELDEPARMASARLERADVHEELGEASAALVDLRAALAARDRTAASAREQTLLEMQTRFETLEQERRIERLQRIAVERDLGLARSEAAREAAEQAQAVEQARRRAAWTLTVAVAGLAVVLTFQWRAKWVAARRLTQQRAELAQALGELHAAHGELKRLYERKSEWLGFAVHELRSPLFGIDGECAEVEAGLAESAPANVGRIRAAAARMRRELDAWLEAERREQSEVQLQAVGDELGRLAAEVVELNGPAARAKSISLAHLAVTPAPARVDPWRWREVVDNLVSNAIKFSPAGSRVAVRTGVTGERAWCRVEDEGPGLTADDRARIYGAYARLSAQPTAGEPSTGLGLFGVKRLVEAHGGEITVENRATGGAVFTVTVPRPADNIGA